MAEPKPGDPATPADFERVKEYITSKYHPSNHASAYVLAEAFRYCGLAVSIGEPPEMECGLCGREFGESHRGECVSGEDYVG